MPYITNSQKLILMSEDGAVLYPQCVNNVGELTWMLYKIVKIYLAKGQKRYAEYAQIIAALDNTKAEFRRRELDPYEDCKRQENGDV